MLYSKTQSIKKGPRGKEKKAVKDRGGVGVGMTAVKDSMVFFLGLPLSAHVIT